MKKFNFSIFPLIVLLAAGFSAFAQETQTRVVDEVVAQINDGVITLSRVKRETRNLVDLYIQEGKKRDEAEKLVEDKQGEIIANLINEELLIQKAKELGLDRDIESTVNQHFVEIMRQYNMKTLEALYAEMEKNGVNPEEIRENWRKEAIRDSVIRNEVQSKLYWSYSGKDLKDYYEKHLGKFTRQETVSISEIFFGFAGRDETAVRTKAKQVYDQLKAGGDFAKLAKENPDPGVVTQGTGKAEKLKVGDLSQKLNDVIRGVKVGDVAPPFDAEQLGIVILRIDAREQASSESVFDESAVRLAMMTEQLPDEQKKYFGRLRTESFIKINDSYRPLVSPILYADERKDKPGN